MEHYYAPVHNKNYKPEFPEVWIVSIHWHDKQYKTLYGVYPILHTYNEEYARRIGREFYELGQDKISDKYFNGRDGVFDIYVMNYPIDDVVHI